MLSFRFNVFPFPYECVSLQFLLCSFPCSTFHGVLFSPISESGNNNGEQLAEEHTIIFYDEDVEIVFKSVKKF